MTDSEIEKPIEEQLIPEMLRDPNGYDAFIQVCKNKNISSSLLPTYQEWLDLVGTDDETRRKLGFVMPPGRIPATLATARGLLSQIGISAANQDSFVKAAGEKLKDEIRANAQRTASRIFQNFAESVDEGGGDGGTSEAGYKGGSSWNPTGLSLKNKPINVSFDADINFIGADKYFLDGAEANTPLLVKCGTPGLILNNTDMHGDTALENYFLGPICQAYQRAIAERITFSSGVIGLFTPTRIRQYINNCLQAVCTYYFWMSVLAYTSDSRNKNTAMEVLADSLSPTEKDNLIILKKTIEKSVIPPFIHKWAFYIMGNFKQSHVPGSPLIKFMPWKFKASTTTVFKQMDTVVGSDGATYGSITAATKNLLEVRDLFDVLGAAFPDWTNLELYEYTSSPEVDMNFSNMWCNGYYKTTGKTSSGYVTRVLPSIGHNVDASIIWNSQTDAPKGWSQAMQSIHYIDGSQEKVGPGFFASNIILPFGGEMFAFSNYIIQDSIAHSCHTTCLIYDGSTPGSEGFVDVSLLSRYQSLALNTYSTTVASITTHSHQKHGCALIKLQSIDVIRQACFKWLDLYIQDLKDAPASSKWNSNSSKGNKSRYSRGNKNKVEKEEM